MEKLPPIERIPEVEVNEELELLVKFPPTVTAPVELAQVPLLLRLPVIAVLKEEGVKVPVLTVTFPLMVVVPLPPSKEIRLGEPPCLVIVNAPAVKLLAPMASEATPFALGVPVTAPKVNVPVMLRSAFAVNVGGGALVLKLVEEVKIRFPRPLIPYNSDVSGGDPAVPLLVDEVIIVKFCPVPVIEVPDCIQNLPDAF